jgi:hypothetical protein
MGAASPARSALHGSRTRLGAQLLEAGGGNSRRHVEHGHHLFSFQPDRFC